MADRVFLHPILQQSKNGFVSAALGFFSPAFVRRLAGIGVAIAASIPAFCLAQFESGSLTGRITDTTGAAIPGVTVTLTAEATGQSFTKLTNEIGLYSFPVVKPGVYSISAELPGFQKVVRRDVRVDVNQRLEVNLTLLVGEISEVVEVSGETPLLETVDSTRGQVIHEQVIRELPLNGRNYEQLVTLSVGANRRASEVEGGFNINGNRLFQNNYILDGVDNNVVANNTRGGTQFVQPSVDAIQEFKVQTSGYSAEFGRGAGGVINATIKSGTNRLHGSVFEFDRNDALDARNFFDPADSSPEFRRHQFGFTLGGPFVKDKLFFFGDYEGLREARAQTFVSTIPNKNNLTAEGILLTRNIVNPATGEPFDPGNSKFLPAEFIDPRAVEIFNLLPEPNVPGRENRSSNFVFNPLWTTRDDRFDVRIDYKKSDALTFFGRYSFRDITFERSGNLPGLIEGGTSTTNSNEFRRSQGVALGATHTVSPNVVNETRIGWGRVAAFRNPLNADSPSPAELIGIPGLPSGSLVSGGLPKLQIAGFRDLGRHTFVPQFQIPAVVTFKDTVSLQKGRHSFKIGGEYRRTRNQFFDQRSTIGAFNFTGALTGDSLADFFLFIPEQARLTTPSVFTHGQDFIFGFVQDDWKLTPELTLNLGFRYELGTPLKEENNRQANFRPEIPGLVLAEKGSLEKRGLVDVDYNNFGPRLGFAYQLNERAVLRGGFGIFYNIEDRRGSESVLSGNPPFVVDAVLQGDRTARTPAIDTNIGFPSDTLSPDRVDFRNVLLRVQEEGFRAPYVQQWNLTLQMELLPQTVFDLAYVGNKGTNLPALRNLNQALVGPGSPNARRPIVGFGDIQWLETRDNSTYHSFQLRAEHRFKDGFYLLGSYTLSKAITGASENLGRSGGFERNPQNSFDLRSEKGLAEFDVRQNLVISSVWDLPLGRNRRFGRDWSSALNSILGGWQINAIAQFRDGFADNVRLLSRFAPNLGTERALRPDLVGKPFGDGFESSVSQFFNSAAFTVPQGSFGTAGRGILRQPGFINFDFSVFKSFYVGEEFRIEFRTEFFNLFNRTNFNGGETRFGRSDFGEISSALDSRQIQFALKVVF